MDNEDKEASDDESKDVTHVESVCKEMGFVMHADQSYNSRFVHIVFICYDVCSVFV